jgi:hypothetical protein
MGIKMPKTRKHRFLQWARRKWPQFLIEIGVVAVFLWVIVLGWLITEAIALIF